MHRRVRAELREVVDVRRRDDRAFGELVERRHARRDVAAPIYEVPKRLGRLLAVEPVLARDLLDAPLDLARADLGAAEAGLVRDRARDALELDVALERAGEARVDAEPVDDAARRAVREARDGRVRRQVPHRVVAGARREAVDLAGVARGLLRHASGRRALVALVGGVIAPHVGERAPRFVRLLARGELRLLDLFVGGLLGDALLLARGSAGLAHDAAKDLGLPAAASGKESRHVPGDLAELLHDEPARFDRALD